MVYTAGVDAVDCRGKLFRLEEAGTCVEPTDCHR